MMALFTPFLTAAAIGDCICATLKSPDRGEDVWDGDCCVWPGSRVPMDACCKNGKGQASVVALEGFPTVSFPAPVSTATICGQGTHSWATVYEITVTRCVPVEPSCDCVCKEQAAARIMGDLEAIVQGLTCCFAETLEDCSMMVFRGWRLIPPQGGCSGVVAAIVVESESPCCPPEGE